MSATEATAEVFSTSFKSLKRREREAVFDRILSDAIEKAHGLGELN